MNCPVHGNKLQEIKFKLPNPKKYGKYGLVSRFVVMNVRRHMSILRGLKKRN